MVLTDVPLRIELFITRNALPVTCYCRKLNVMFPEIPPECSAGNSFSSPSPAMKLYYCQYYTLEDTEFMAPWQWRMA